MFVRSNSPYPSDGWELDQAEIGLENPSGGVETERGIALLEQPVASKNTEMQRQRSSSRVFRDDQRAGREDLAAGASQPGKRSRVFCGGLVRWVEK